MYRIRTKMLTLLLGLMAVSASSAFATAEEYKPGDVFKDCEKCPSMVVVPAGSFMKGANPKWKTRSSAELPTHKVKIAKSFAIGRFEVTVGEFEHFLNESGYKQLQDCWYIKSLNPEVRVQASYKNPGFKQSDKHPVVCVSWLDAQAYIKWLGAKTGKSYYLPSEAEWEYAARAGTTTRYWWGDAASKSKANYNHNTTSAFKREGTVRVDHFKPNPFGLYGVVGNVGEWCLDHANLNYKNSPNDGSAWYGWDGIRKKKKLRRTRGGAWVQFSVPLTTRLFASENVQLTTMGFRVVRKVNNE